MNGLIGPHDAKLEVEVGAFACGACTTLDNPRAILGMDPLDKVFEAAHGVAGGQAEQAVQILVPVEGIGENIPLERSGTRSLQRRAQSLLAGAKLVLRRTLLADVCVGAEPADDATLRIAHRHDTG